ncbi:helix-turn-helix domain-containing protein [Aureitalea sp. L0-47]|uniref:helix-turn-helix domain-containing protein n=1 Tax=Aureitalea sp. L0-47 TaxID=2816962 RepID=UPI0022390C40|nr:ImmA/IrrE family metallo-endopeptidase [Aureitalea sp. L0-47]
MISLARESRGLSQTELSKVISISQGKLSKVEKGEQTIGDDILYKLAQVLEYPLQFFYQPTPSSPVSHLYYRKRITISNKIISKMEANIKIFRQNIDALMNSIELPNLNIPFCDPNVETPEQIARKARLKLNIGKGPVENLVNTLEKNGIVIVTTDLFNEKTDAVSTISDNGTHIIYLNERMPQDRQRFSLAHELGHLIMHFRFNSDPSFIEKEADRFASEFLMPENEIKSSLRNLTFNKLSDLKRYWKVSMRALVRRARDLGSISQNDYRNFQIGFSKRGLNKSEPIPVPKEIPFVIKEVVKLHITELNYSIEDLAKFINLNVREFQQRFIRETNPKLKIV